MTDRTSTATPTTYRRNRWRARLRRAMSVALALALAAACYELSKRWSANWDLSASASNRLSLATTSILTALDSPCQIRAFLGAGAPAGHAIRQLLHRYQAASDQITVEIIDPEQQPRLAREADVRAAAEVEIFFAGRREKITRPSEVRLSAALARLMREADIKIGVLRGHGERALDLKSNTSLGRLADRAKAQGFELISLDLNAARRIPDNIDALLILANTEAPLRFEVLAIQAYLARGGNLIWLFDPAERNGFDDIATGLGLELSEGLVVDPSSRINGRSTPEFIVVREFSSHPLVEGMAQSQVIFPTAGAINWRSSNGWKPKTLAASSLNSWLETGDLSAAVRFDDGIDSIGPLDILVALERALPQRNSQRVVVAADVDFVSNAYIGLGANYELARRIFDWTTRQDASLTLEQVRAKDLDFNANTWQRAIIAIGAPIVLPLLLGFGAFRMWRKTRQ